MNECLTREELIEVNWDFISGAALLTSIGLALISLSSATFVLVALRRDKRQREAGQE